jgi:MFS family permease
MNKSDLKTRLFIVGITLLVFICSTNINWGGDRSKNIIRSDAKCYYLYLPGVFIYNDLNFGFVQNIEFVTYNDKFNCRDCREYIDGKAYSKVTSGVAIAQLPFFLGAHILARPTGYLADGYSTPYQISITLAAVLYLFMGLWFLNLFLATFQIKPNSRIIAMLCCVFGTNLFYYTIGEPGLSHVYSFAFINLLFYYVRQYFVKGSSRYIIRSGIILGIIFLIRPVNMIIMPALLFLAGDWQNLTNKFRILKQKYWALIISFACFAFLIGIQVAIFMIQTGHLWIYTYGKESFDFSKPEILNILFSYKKGLFLYTPMYLISLFGLYFMYKKQKWATIVLSISLLFFTYIVSSWWSWWYGGSFSSRVYVDILVYFMLPLAYLVEAATKKLHRILLIIALFLVIALCQIQTYQYRYYIIHWDSMTKEKYWDNFLRIE